MRDLQLALIALNLLSLGLFVIWLHIRIRRIEQPAADTKPSERPGRRDRCRGALCKAGRLPNGDPCRLCQPPACVYCGRFVCGHTPVAPWGSDSD